MTERIVELIKQSGGIRCDEDGDELTPILVGKDLEKFAELIVKECMQVGGPEDSYTDEWFKAKADSVVKIKQHFGVED